MLGLLQRLRPSDLRQPSQCAACIAGRGGRSGLKRAPPAHTSVDCAPLTPWTSHSQRLSSKVELVQVQIEPSCHAGVAGSAKDPDVGDSTIRPPAKPFVDQAESIEDAAQAKHCMCVHTIRLDILTKKGYADNRTLLPALWPEFVRATKTVATTCHCTPVNDGELHHGHTLQHGHPSWVTVQVQCKG